MTTLDCRDKKCPHPVVETRKQLLAQPNEALTVLVGDQTAVENVSRLAVSQGFALKVADVDGGFALELNPAGQKTVAEEQPVLQGKTVALIASDEMGLGEPELGRILLKNFIYTLAEAEQAPDQMLFINTGVKLTVEGAETLEALEALACMGTEIASCGLCLDFFNLKEKLAVGRVGTMLDVVEALNGAGRIIRP